MNRKWWKILLPVPFIFLYCYCVSFTGRGEKDSVATFAEDQREPQGIPEPKPAGQTALPPPTPPVEEGSQSPPQLSAKPVTPVPKHPSDEAVKGVPIKSEPPKAIQSEVAPEQNTPMPAAPPHLSSEAMQILGSSPETPDPTPVHTVKNNEENDEVIMALTALSALENETTQESSPEPPALSQAQELPLTQQESVKKQKADEYARSTAKVSVPQETFEADKRRIMTMISELNVCMEKGDYKGWITCLSDESRTYWSKPQNLRKAAAKLPISGIRLNDMEDYFNYVFIPARRGRKVEEIRYVTETQVKAVQVEDDVDMVFYHFKKVDGKWRLFLPKIKD